MIDLRLGDCLEVLQSMEDNSVDSIVTDPPYGLSFMGRKWDYDVPSVDIWVECLRVLKPGGHLLAFAGTRTQHRMCVNIEDAGFEIRDMIAWIYASGFPKSHNIGKAIDKAAGAEREVIGSKLGRPGCTTSKSADSNCYKSGINNSPEKALITAPATPEAQQWDGWGTALKPAWESVTVATKPAPVQGERGRMMANLWKLEARLWLLSSASAAAQSSTSSQNEFDAACATAQWTADDLTSTRDALSAQMDTSRCVSTASIALSIVSSWRNTLTEILSDGNTSITATELKTTTDWKTLNCCLSQITPESIIQACNQIGGFNANASTAGQIFNASLASLQSTLTLSAIEPVMWQALESSQGVGVKPSLDPVVMARKPFKGTCANNVLTHGTGAINIDECRVGSDTIKVNGWKCGGEQVYNGRQFEGFDGGTHQGRWPANLIHDGSEEVTELFGDAARYFYVPKCNKKDRDGSTHPTMKPTDLMAYLCRLVTPPEGIVLDPFMGSGSTGKAAVREGFSFIGIERDPEYYAIAEGRVVQPRREQLSLIA